MTIGLTKAGIDAALGRLERRDVETYAWLQAQRGLRNLRSDPEYRKKFNGFYRVRRGREWQAHFYDLFERAKGRAMSFAEVLEVIHEATGRWEASFASKLLATVDPDMPVIDSVVLGNLGLRLPAYGAADRAAGIEEIHHTLAAGFREFLPTEEGRYLVGRFRAEYPDVEITPTKMLDFVLWKTVPTQTPARIKSLPGRAAGLVRHSAHGHQARGGLGRAAEA